MLPSSERRSHTLAAADPSHAPIDPNGNLTQEIEGGVTWTYAWDAENHLKWVCNTTPCTEAASVASFKYDAFGRRVEKVAGGVTTTYTYDGEDILRQIAGGSTLKFVHGPSVDDPLAQEDGGGVLSYFHADGLGSIVKTTSAAGAVTSTRRYDAFGNFELGAANGYSFTGREWDFETGLAYYRARYYDPKIGRFISEDPIRFEDGPNVYLYARANPIVFTDPTGESCEEPTCRLVAKCRPVNHFVGKIGMKHCELEFQSSTSPPTNFSAGPQEYGVKGTRLVAGPKPGPADGKVSDSIDVDCSIIGCLESNSATFNGAKKYGALGPNSNSYVDWVTLQCGVSVKMPRMATGRHHFRKRKF